MKGEEEYNSFYLAEAADDRRLERIETDAKLCESEIDWEKFKKEKKNSEQQRIF